MNETFKLTLLLALDVIFLHPTKFNINSISRKTSVACRRNKCLHKKDLV